MNNLRRKIMMSYDLKSSTDVSNYLTIEALEDGLTAQLSRNAVEYCVDGDDNWKSLAAGTATESINTGQTLSFRGNLTPNSSNGIGTFTISKRCNLKGNVMSMLFGDNAVDNYSLSGKNYAFSKLFYNCNTIINANNLYLPATTLANYCYYYMFYNCNRLTTAPELPAITLAEGCYHTMFYNCYRLTIAPELPATTLTKGCYNYMFQYCTGLTTAPELPATTLANYCYQYMFSGCTGLTITPELPATTLAEGCYNSMFYGTNILPDCSNIDFTNSNVVASRGLRGLFAGTKVTDSDLNSILPKNNNGKYCLPAITLATYCYERMFYSCSNLTTAPELLATTLASNCYENMFYGCHSLTTAPEILPATTLAYRCCYYMFYNCTGLTTAPELPATTLANNCYERMFWNCTGLTTAPTLPATTLADGCYNYMFNGCSSLKTAPELPATTLLSNCYFGMFMNCTGLTTAPELPATTLSTTCYSHMFYGCTNLTTAPELPATTLATICYSSMFNGCTNLTTAPELPATTLANRCYETMFYNCTKLNYIKMLATNISASDCLYNWVSGVSSTGTFVKNAAMTTIPTGSNGIPRGWTVSTIITIHIDNKAYQAESWMTWVDFVNSSYNYDGFVIDEDIVKHANAILKNYNGGGWIEADSLVSYGLDVTLTFTAGSNGSDD